MNRTELESLIREILSELMPDTSEQIKKVALQTISVNESDRLETENPNDQVYTHDLFTLTQSPRLGCGIMEMTRTEFPWTLSYDEIDYVISGTLTIQYGSRSVTAKAGELILIPKGSSIRFSVPDFARFLYVTYPADWQNSSETA